MKTDAFRRLEERLYEEIEIHQRIVYPPLSKVLKALNMTDINQIKVVIIGQDPYHAENQATGLAFSVPRDLKRIPPSLQNIYKEIRNDYPEYMQTTGPTFTHGCLGQMGK